MRTKWKTEVPAGKFWLSIGDVEKILGINYERIRILMATGIIPAVKIGPKWYTDRPKLNAWLTSLYTDRFEGAKDGGRQPDRSDGPEATSGTPAKGEGECQSQ